MNITECMAFDAAARWFSRVAAILFRMLLLPMLSSRLGKKKPFGWILFGQNRAVLAVFGLGFSVAEPFAQEFPGHFLNAGVAEHNMTRIAAGLASEGFHVFTYSIANFPTFRCLEQIRNDVCHHNLAVTFVAVGGGLACGNLGYSHHALQDLVILRTRPGMTVLAPGDPADAQECVGWLARHPGAAYLRIGKAGESKLHGVGGIEHGPLLIRKGTTDIALVTTGGILDEALAAHEVLAMAGHRVPVYSLPWLKPLSPRLLAALAPYRCLVTVEEHLPEGGLAAALREQRPGTLVRSVAVPEEVSGKMGNQAFLRRESGVSADHIVALCRGLLG